MTKQRNLSDCCRDLTYTQPIQEIDVETELLVWTYIRKCNRCHKPCTPVVKEKEDAPV